MNYLLDTHAILLYAQGNQELSQKAKAIMENEQCFYSIASFWEIAIKQKLGKLDNALTIPELEELCKNSGFVQLPTISQYVEHTKSLDFIHRDPFDRLLVAQAKTEKMLFITHDSLIPFYHEDCVFSV